MCIQCSFLTWSFFSLNPKYKDPSLGPRAKEHKVCILARISIESWEDASELGDFAMGFPQPFVKFWYLGSEGEERLKAAKQTQEARLSLASGQGGAGSSVGGEDGGPRRIIFTDAPGDVSKAPVQRSKVWDCVRITASGKSMKADKKGDVERMQNWVDVSCILGEGGNCKHGWTQKLWGGTTGAIFVHVRKISDDAHKKAAAVLNLNCNLSWLTRSKLALLMCLCHGHA